MSLKDVVQVSAYYPPHLGGQENVVRDLAAQLAAAGHYVQVLTSAIGGGSEGSAVEQNVNVNRMQGFVFGHAPVMPAFPITLFRKTHAGSIVHLHIGQAFTPEMVWLVSRIRRFKYIAELHIDFAPSGRAGFLLPLYKRFVLRRVLHSADSVIVLNEAMRRIVRKSYGYSGRISVVQNGIDEGYFLLKRPPLPRHPPKTTRLLFVGRLSKQKNIPTLLKALTLLKQDVHLDLIGDGEERETIEQAIQTYGLTNVTLHGRLGRERVMEYYASCDALVMPSLYEAQPLVLLEAMAVRIPIIGTNVVGVADHIGDAGIIVEPTAEGLAAGIARYYASYSELSNMVERGYETAQKFRWRHALKGYEELYEATMDN